MLLNHVCPSKTFLIAVMFVISTRAAFVPRGDVQIFTMTGCTTPDMGDASCPHNPSGGNDETDQPCSGTTSSWTSASDVMNCSVSRVAAAVLLETSGKNTEVSQKVLVYTKENDRKKTLVEPTAQDPETFVPSQTVQISASPVVAEAMLYAFLPNSKISPSVGRNGVVAWDYSIATRAWNPSKDEKESCDPFEYACSNRKPNTNSASDFTEAGVLPSCDTNNHCQQYFPEVSSWYADDVCAAALSPYTTAGSSWSDFCWHSTCGSYALNDELDLVMMQQDDMLTGVALTCNKTMTKEAKMNSELLNGQFYDVKPNVVTDLQYRGANDHKWAQCGLNPGPAVTTPNTQMTSLQCENVMMPVDKFTGSYSDNLDVWGTEYQGTVFQTQTTKCGRLYKATQPYFNYRTNLTIQVKNSLGSLVRTTHELTSDAVPTPWIPTDECAISENDPGCFHFKVESWDTSKGAMDASKITGGKFVLEYPWTGPDENGPDTTDWKTSRKWAFFGGYDIDETWRNAQGYGAVDSTGPQPMSIHGGKTGDTTTREANSVCNSRPLDPSDPPLSTTSTGWLYPGFAASEGSDESSLQDSGFLPSKGSPVLFPSTTLWADGTAHPAAESQSTYSNMMFQNYLFETGKTGQEGFAGVASIGPYMPWYNSDEEDIPVSSRSGAESAGPRPFYWLTNENPAGTAGEAMPMFHAQAFSTTANILVYVLMPTDSVAVIESPQCTTPANVSVMSCSSVLGSNTGGLSVEIQNPNPGWCSMFYETECDGSAIPGIDSSGSTELDAGGSKQLTLPVIPTSTRDFQCTVHVYVGETNVTSQVASCTVLNITPNSTNIYEPELAQCVNCKAVGRGNTTPKKTNDPTTLVIIITSSVVGVAIIAAVPFLLKT